MTLMRYKSPVMPTSSVDRLASELFGQNISRLMGSDGFHEHTPRANVVEAEEEYWLEMQVPGFDKKDLKVDMVNDTITVRGEHTEEESRENERWTRREFGRTAFERSFVIPEAVKADGIKADYVNGVLRLTIPKSEEARPKTRAISIR